GGAGGAGPSRAEFRGRRAVARVRGCARRGPAVEALFARGAREDGTANGRCGRRATERGNGGRLAFAVMAVQDGRELLERGRERLHRRQLLRSQPLERFDELMQPLLVRTLIGP